MFEMDTILLPCFILNFLLIMLDASVGYNLAPLLFSATGGSPDESEGGVRSIRRLLTGVVMLYMFFNCWAYFNYMASLLLIVTLVVLFDLGGQLYVRYRFRQQKDDLTDHNEEV